MSSSDDGLVHVLTVVNQGMREPGKYFCVLRSPLRSTPDKMTQTITSPGEWWEIFGLENYWEIFYKSFPVVEMYWCSCSIIPIYGLMIFCFYERTHWDCNNVLCRDFLSLQYTEALLYILEKQVSFCFSYIGVFNSFYLCHQFSCYLLLSNSGGGESCMHAPHTHTV